MSLSKQLLELLAVSAVPMSRKQLYMRVESMEKPFNFTLRTLHELDLVVKPKNGHYELTEFGQSVLNHVRGSKC